MWDRCIFVIDKQKQTLTIMTYNDQSQAYRHLLRLLSTQYERGSRSGRFMHEGNELRVRHNRDEYRIEFFVNSEWVWDFNYFETFEDGEVTDESFYTRTLDDIRRFSSNRMQ